MQPENETETETETTETADSEQQDEQTSRTFTQDEVNKLVAKARRQGGQSERKSLVETLGVESVDAAAEVLRAQREAQAAEMSEADKARAEAAEALARAEAVERQAREATLRADLTVELSKGRPINPERVEAALRLGVPHALTLDSDEPAAEAAEWIRETLPELFSTPDTGQQGEDKETGSSTGSAQDRKRGDSASGTSKERAAYEDWKSRRSRTAQPPINL